MNSSSLRGHAAALLITLAAFGGVGAFAQPTTDPALARQRYEREIAACNTSQLPAPTREACVRAAGVALDRLVGGTPNQTPTPSADGRATIVAPDGASLPAGGGAPPTTTTDGRATIVPPADRTPVR